METSLCVIHCLTEDMSRQSFRVAQRHIGIKMMRIMWLPRPALNGAFSDQISVHPQCVSGAFTLYLTFEFICYQHAHSSM